MVFHRVEKQTFFVGFKAQQQWKTKHKQQQRKLKWKWRTIRNAERGRSQSGKHKCTVYLYQD